MAKLPGQGFDAEGDFDESLLPDGWYPFEIVDSEFCEGSKEGSTYIKIVADGVPGSPADGVRIWQNYTYTNKTPTAVRMGKKQFKKLCKACGVGGNVSDTSVLHGRRFLGEVYTEKGKDGWDDKNQFNDYNNANAATAGGAPAPPPAQPQPQQSYAPPQPPQNAAPPAPGWTGQQPQQPPQQPQQTYATQPPQQPPQQPQQPQQPPQHGNIPTAPPQGQPPQQPGAAPAPWQRNQ